MRLIRVKCISDKLEGIAERGEIYWLDLDSKTVNGEVYSDVYMDRDGFFGIGTLYRDYFTPDRMIRCPNCKASLSIIADDGSLKQTLKCECIDETGHRTRIIYLKKKRRYVQDKSRKKPIKRLNPKEPKKKFEDMTIEEKTKVKILEMKKEASRCYKLSFKHMSEHNANEWNRWLGRAQAFSECAMRLEDMETANG